MKRSPLENFNQEWAIEMKELLLEAKAYSETHEYPLIPLATNDLSVFSLKSSN